MAYLPKNLSRLTDRPDEDYDEYDEEELEEEQERQEEAFYDHINKEIERRLYK